MSESNPSAQSATESDAAAKKKRDDVIRLLLWLRPVLGCLVALILGLWILCMMERTIFPMRPSQVPPGAKDGKPATPTAAAPAWLQGEAQLQTPRVWALGATLAAEVSALTLVLFAAARIAREE